MYLIMRGRDLARGLLDADYLGRFMHKLLTLAFAVVLGAAPATAAPSEIRVYESHDDSSITEGNTVITADPDQAYLATADYARWSAMFPDIRDVRITQQRGVDARVTFVHAAGNRDNLHFHNQPAARMVWFEDTGGRAEVWAEIIFLPGTTPGTTYLRARLYADVHGVASLFVSDGKLRGLRQERVRDYLVKLRAYFARNAQSVAGPNA
jgi:hypothetical protein